MESQANQVPGCECRHADEMCPRKTALFTNQPADFEALKNAIVVDGIDSRRTKISRKAQPS